MAATSEGARTGRRRVAILGVGKADARNLRNVFRRTARSLKVQRVDQQARVIPAELQQRESRG